MNRIILAIGKRPTNGIFPRFSTISAAPFVRFSSADNNEDVLSTSSQKAKGKKRSFIQQLQSDFGRAATSGPEVERPRTVVAEAAEEHVRKQSVPSKAYGDDEIEIPVKFSTRARQRRATAGKLSRQAEDIDLFQGISKGVKDLDLINSVNKRAFSEDIGDKTEFLSNAGSGKILAKATLNIDQSEPVVPSAIQPESVKTVDRQKRLKRQLELSELGNRMAGSEVIGDETAKIPVDATGPVLQGQYQTGTERDAENARNLPWRNKYRGSGRAT